MKTTYVSAMLLAAFAVFIVPSAEARAESAYFSAQIGADMITVAAQMRYARETPYVALDEIMHQIGGSVAAQPENIQVNWGGTTALLTVNDIPVRLPGVSFPLIHPARQQGDMVFISVSDVPHFFQNAYDLTLSRVERVETPAVPTLTAITPEEEEDLELLDSSLLETIDVPDGDPDLLSPLEEDALQDTEAPAEPDEMDEADETDAADDLSEQDEDPDADDPPMPRTLDLSELSGTGGSIVLDPGHGGQDSGAVGGNDLSEKEVVLSIALRVRTLLTENTNIKVQLTRETDTDLGLSQRRAIAQTGGGHVFVSLHAGFSVTPRAQGASIFTDQGIQSSESTLSTTGREHVVARQRIAEKAGTLGYRMARALGDDSILGHVAVRSCPLLLQRDMEMPVVLVEIAYLSNIDAATLLSEDEYQDQVALNLAWAIAHALKQS